MWLRLFFHHSMSVEFCNTAFWGFRDGNITTAVNGSDVCQSDRKKKIIVQVYDMASQCWLYSVSIVFKECPQESSTVQQWSIMYYYNMYHIVLYIPGR